MNKHPNCVECGRIELLPVNYEVFGLIEKYPMLLSNNMGGISADGIKFVLEVENIPDILKVSYTRKICEFYSTAFATKQG